MTTFGKWLRTTRIKRGMTQRQLAQSLGVTHSYISHLEHGRYLSKDVSPARRSAPLIDAMADVLGVPREEARRVARYSPPEPVLSAPLNPEPAVYITDGSARLGVEMMVMILKLPLYVQEDLKAHVEKLYMKYCG